ncbi:hypothetical protein [Methyloceanibacter sp.]|uniref:hypothetical protein n=1 Tax=Methyloceanibacter sp. TaxID=1965321 RepID=UPI003D6CAD3A
MPAPDFKVLAALLVLGGMAVAYAKEAPDNVAAEVAEAVQSCKDLEGTPNADAVLSTKDVNGDGGEDWIADYSKLSCQGGINQMCDDEGCVLQIYLWNGSTAWNLAFDEAVKSYKFSKSHGQHLLQVVTAGSACPKPAGTTCRLTYRLYENEIEPEP